MRNAIEYWSLVVVVAAVAVYHKVMVSYGKRWEARPPPHCSLATYIWGFGVSPVGAFLGSGIRVSAHPYLLRIEQPCGPQAPW